MPFEMIYSENTPTIVQVYKQFKINYKLREDYEIENQSKEENKEKTHHAIPQSDPLFSFIEHSNGNKH